MNDSKKILGIIISVHILQLHFFRLSFGKWLRIKSKSGWTIIKKEFGNLKNWRLKSGRNHHVLMAKPNFNKLMLTKVVQQRSLNIFIPTEHLAKFTKDLCVRKCVSMAKNSDRYLNIHQNWICQNGSTVNLLKKSWR